MRPAADQILRIPLAPLLAAQGLGVRRRANTLPEPPGARQGQAGKGAPLRLLIVGDSSAAGVGARSQDAALSGQVVKNLAEGFDVSWKLIGESSITTTGMLKRLATVPPSAFDVAITALGVNDVTRASSRAKWVKRQSELAEVLSSKFAVQTIVASGLPPMGAYPELPQPLRWVLGAHAKRLDDALADLAATHRQLTHLPLNLPFEPRYQASDGYHPSEEAYAIWAAMFADHIRAQLHLS
ncbi:SGNH/GDSL hydrolase family protein [Shimia sp. MMG029]|uniref:SGNH/GDSL hydrolase family protein n=1 Tax=Shimia sp. MMG029 TaxID=3021978 RepID=UPI0022FE29B4|nr:SGNH/GDSL hydrolase family protein [Shimia sp. MMG029]MDA5556535.1 SGNH/GDSL hydrolase family protein [Shimia sp. MMG029]